MLSWDPSSDAAMLAHTRVWCLDVCTAQSNSPWVSKRHVFRVWSEESTIRKEQPAMGAGRSKCGKGPLGAGAAIPLHVPSHVYRRGTDTSLGQQLSLAKVSTACPKSGRSITDQGLQGQYQWSIANVPLRRAENTKRRPLRYRT